MIALSDAEPVLADKNTVCPTRKLQAVIPMSLIVQRAVLVPATIAVVTFTYFVCKRPCSSHLIKSDVDGNSALT